MRIKQLGEGEPELAILGGVHGDEPCGVHAIETLLDEAPDVQRPVKCIIANERALSQGVRYTESDLNRVFPGDRSSETYEKQLAASLVTELEGCTILSMHSTQSHGRPFAIVDETGPLAKTICPYLSIDAIVEANDAFKSALVNHAEVIEVECGKQGTDEAAANAERLVREFLSATGAFTEERTTPEGTVPIYQIDHLITKPDADMYAVLVDNFERVEEGEPYATVDSQVLTADESRYHVLMSATGYKSQFGYAADLIGHLRRN